MSTIKEFQKALYDFHRTKAGDNDNQYHSIESLCTIAEQYILEELNMIDLKEFKSMRLYGITSAAKKSGLITWLKDKIKSINDCVLDEADNDLGAAQKLYSLLFIKDTGAPRYKRMITSIASRFDFYRVRSADKYILYDRKGMFIISDSLKKMTGAYRFNPSGYACLYLASNLYLAWEECRRPDFDTVNFSRFQNRRQVKVLNLEICREYKFKEHFLMSYLALLCCAKTIDEDKYKFQYIVPQMMMKVLCHSQRCAEQHAKKSGVTVVDEIAGIKYMSSRRYDQKDFLFADIDLSYAFVFPQHPHDVKHDVCPYLAELFRLTEPRTYFLYKTHRYDFYDRKAYISNYQDSLFYQLEEELKKEKLGKYDEK